jgi:hypothetical protein
MKRLLCASGLAFMLSFQALAQDIQLNKPVTMSGQVSAYAEKYSMTGNSRAVHDPTTGRLQVNLNFNFFGVIEMPLNAILATDQVSFRQSINQFGISPKFGCVTLHGGHFAPQFSELTLSDATVLGGGVDVSPGPFRFSLLSGQINRAIDYNSDNALPVYSRYLTGFQAGYGSTEKSFINVNIVRSKDNLASLPDTSSVAAQENLVAGINWQCKLFDDRLTIANEISGSAYTRDMRAAEAEIPPISSFNSLFVPRTSSSADWATVTRLQYGEASWSGEAKIAYIRPGYISFGFSQLQADMFEYTLGGRARMLNGALSLNASFGQRQNNLLDDQANTTKRLILNLGSSYQVTQAFGFDLNYGTNTNDVSSAINDTTSITNINNTISVTPRLAFTTGSLQHSMVASVSYQNTDNSTRGSIQLQNAKTLATMFNWALSYGSPLSFNLTAVITSASVDTLNTSIVSLTPTANYTPAGGKFSGSFGLEIGVTSPSSQSSDNELFPQLQINYSIAQRQSLSFRFTHRAYTYGVPPPGGDSFQETIATLRYTLSF